MSDQTPEPPRTSWIDPRVEVRGSAIEGQGEFATTVIRAGEVIKRLGGRVISDVEMSVVIATGRRYSAMRVAADVHLLMAWDDPASRGNHSCDPTAWLEAPFTVVARRDIEAGEEITTDYATMTADEAWVMACRCGTAACRGIVTGEDWRLVELRERYRGHFVPWIEEMQAQA